MEPFDLMLMTVFAGGAALGVFFIWLHRGRHLRTDTDPFARDGLSTDVINCARIRVAGVGGLGLTAMALVVAWIVPRIRQSLALGFVLGVALAGVLILLRRRKGPLPSSGRRAGANTTLAIDTPPGPEGDRPDYS